MSKAKSKNDPAAVDAYLTSLPADERQVLQELRQLIKTEVPDFQERISYGTAVIFAIKKDLVGFVAQKNHLSFFTMSPGLAEAMKDEIQKTHKVSGATIHFSPENPLPDQIVKKIINARILEHQD